MYLDDTCRLLSNVGRRTLKTTSNDNQTLLVPRTDSATEMSLLLAPDYGMTNDLSLKPLYPVFRQQLKTTVFDRNA